MGLFKRNKKDEKKKTDELSSLKEELKETVTDTDITENYGLEPEVAKAIDNIIPVISNGDLNLIPSVYNSETLTQAIAEATLDDLLILATYAHSFILKDEKNKQGFTPLFLNHIAAGIAERIKNAERIYTVYNNFLRKPYPHIAPGYALIFFSEENANSWVEDYIKTHESEVYVKPLGNEEIKQYFEELSALGIQSIGIECNKYPITITHKPIYGINFETVSDPAVQFFSLLFIQRSKSKIFVENIKQTHGTLLSALISSKYLCPGKTINGNFITASLKKGDSSFISVFTDKTEVQNAINESPGAKQFLETAEFKELTFAELEKFLMLPEISALAINTAGIGFILRREIYENLYKAIKENPNKKVSIKVE